jgi:hypothetical protein
MHPLSVAKSQFDFIEPIHQPINKFLTGGARDKRQWCLKCRYMLVISGILVINVIKRLRIDIQKSNKYEKLQNSTTAELFQIHSTIQWMQNVLTSFNVAFYPGLPMLTFNGHVNVPMLMFETPKESSMTIHYETWIVGHTSDGHTTDVKRLP